MRKRPRAHVLSIVCGGQSSGARWQRHDVVESLQLPKAGEVGDEALVV